MVGYLKHAFFGLSQPKSKRFTPPWGLEIFACGNLNEHIRICAAERASLFLASAHCPVRLGGANVDVRVSRSASVPSHARSRFRADPRRVGYGGGLGRTNGAARVAASPPGL